MSNADWQIFKKDGEPNSKWSLPDPPSWRSPNPTNGTSEGRDHHRGETFQPSDEAIQMVNAALYLRRPLLITGKPGTGKSSLAYAVARQLMLGEVLYWPITTRTTLRNGLYDYDAIGRLQDAKQPVRVDPEQVNRQQGDREQELREELENIGSYITLGPLGTALVPSNNKKPRVLLIDEIDKSDIDLPNDLLTVLEEGRFIIPELVRIKDKLSKITVRTAYTNLGEIEKYEVENGRISCTEFPFVVLTSNGERAFPPAFLRRCLRLNMPVPGKDDLTKIVEAHLGSDRTAYKEAIAKEKGAEAAEVWHQQVMGSQTKLIEAFVQDTSRDIATDQLLNAIFMVTQEYPIDQEKLLKELMKPLTSNEDG
jgi:MoxR-like ATPase